MWSFSPVWQLLHERCDRLKPTLFRLASDTVDDDEALTQILAANDELTLVLNAYKDQFLRRERNSAPQGGTSGEQTEPRGKDATVVIAAAHSGGHLLSVRTLAWSSTVHLACSCLQPQLFPDRWKATTSSTSQLSALQSWTVNWTSIRKVGLHLHIDCSVFTVMIIFYDTDLVWFDLLLTPRIWKSGFKADSRASAVLLWRTDPGEAVSAGSDRLQMWKYFSLECLWSCLNSFMEMIRRRMLSGMVYCELAAVTKVPPHHRTGRVLGKEGGWWRCLICSK